jgi:hypothetical protein
MKALAIIIAALILTGTSVFGKKNAVVVENTHYGVGLAQVNSGSGQGAGYSINGSILKGRKSLEVGLIYSDQESKIAGGDFKYRIMLGNIHRIEDQNKVFTPYLQYNLMYQKCMSYAPDFVNLAGEEYEVTGKPGTIATMGHYLEYGNKIRIFGRAYFDTAIGLGVYQGSVDKINGPDTWGIHGTNSGMTYAFKIGFGYTFN